MTLQSIDQFCGSLNIPGLITVEYAPLHWILASSWEPIRTDAGNHQYTILFSTGTWLQVSLLPAGKLWSEDSQEDEQGNFYPQNISGNTPKLRPAVTAQFEEMERMAFLVRITDRNRQPWIIGTPDTPLYFNARAGTSDERGLNTYEINFAAQTVRRSAGYVPVLP